MAGYNDRRTQAGYTVGQIYSAFEIALLEKRKALFERVIAAKEDFKIGIVSRAKQYEAESDSEALAAFKALTAVVQEEYREGYRDTMAAAVVQKNSNSRSNKTADRTKEILQRMTIATISSMAGVFFGARQTAKNQLMQIAAQVSGNGEGLRAEITRVSADIVRQGLVVPTASGGTKNVVAQGEFIFRNEAENVGRSVLGAIAEDNGNRYARISAHPSSCPKCVPWQNMLVINDVFANAKPDGKTPLISEAIAAGLFHYNCRHDYSIEELGVDRSDIYKHDTASVKETAMRYSVEEKQRYNERNIREWRRREVSALEDEDRANAANKVKEWQRAQHELRQYAKDNNVPFYRQYAREAIDGATVPQEKLTFTAKGDIIGATTAMGQRDYAEMAHLKHKLDNITARKFYLEHLAMIEKQLDKTQTLEEQAHAAFEARNKARTFARELMADSVAAAELDLTEQNATFEDLFKKGLNDGKTEEATYLAIIKSAGHSRDAVNKEIGVI